MLLNDGNDIVVQIGNFGLDDIPDDLVYLHVIVDQHVTGAGDLLPLDRWVLFAELCG